MSDPLRCYWGVFVLQVVQGGVHDAALLCDMQPAFVVSFQLDRKFKTDNQDSVVLVDFDLRHVSE